MIVIVKLKTDALYNTQLRRVESQQLLLYLLLRFEDAIDAFTMIFNGGQYWLLGWTIGNMFSISIFNYSGYLSHKHLYLTLV